MSDILEQLKDQAAVMSNAAEYLKIIEQIEIEWRLYVGD